MPVYSKPYLSELNYLKISVRQPASDISNNSLAVISDTIARTMESKKYLAASDRIDVMVNTVVMPRETRAGVASTAIQKDTQLNNVSN